MSHVAIHLVSYLKSYFFHPCPVAKLLAKVIYFDFIGRQKVTVTAERATAWAGPGAQPLNFFDFFVHQEVIWQYNLAK